MNKTFFVQSPDGHIFACAYRAGYVLVTNEHAKPTRLSMRDFRRLVLGVK